MQAKIKFWQHKTKDAEVNNNRGKYRKFFSQLSGAFMLPISVMAVAGLFLGIGAAINSNATVDELKTFGSFIQNIGDPIFGSMPVLFLIAIIVSYTDDVGTAVFAGVVGFLVFNAVQTPFIKVTPGANDNVGTVKVLDIFISNDFSQLSYKIVGKVFGLTALNTSIVAGIVAGLIIAKLYNKYHTIKLPAIISFFGGKRFVSFIAILVMIPLAFLFLLLWPFVGYVFAVIGENIGKVAGLDSFVFGYIERALVPTGLHHVFYAPLWYTSAGGDVSEAIAKSGATITALNDGAITTATTNLDALQKTIKDLLELKNDAGAPLFANEAAISAGFGALNSNSTSADFNAVFAEVRSSVSGVISAQINSLSSGNIVALSKAVQIAPVTQLNDALIQKIGSNDAGDTFGWLAVNGSGINTVGYNLTQGTSTATAETLPIYQFLDRVAGLRLGRFVQGKYSFMQFGLTAAGAAIVMAAPKENRKTALALVVPAAATSFVTGVTEPIEFTFLFLAPALFWGFHALMAAFSFLFMNLAHAHMGMTFSGGFIDTIVYGIIPVQKGTEFWWSFVIGAGYAPIYYFVFYYVIKRFNLATPGRGDNTRLFTKKDFQAKVDAKHGVDSGASKFVQEEKIIAAFGGYDNIVKYTNCATRLRYDVKDASKVNVDGLKAAGAAGVLKVSPTHVQAIFGPQAEQINTRIQEMAAHRPASTAATTHAPSQLITSETAPKAPEFSPKKTRLNTRVVATPSAKKTPKLAPKAETKTTPKTKSKK